MSKSRRQRRNYLDSFDASRSVEECLADLIMEKLGAPVRHQDPRFQAARDRLLDFATLIRPDLTINWHHRVMCRYLEEWERGEHPLMVLLLPSRHSKPVDVESLVLMANGEQRRLRDVKVGDRIISHRGVPRLVQAVHEQGTLDCIEIKTSCHRRLVAAPDHPVLTARGWLKAGELKIGDGLACVQHAQTEVRSVSDLFGHNVPDESFRLLGYFIGDGNATYVTASLKYPTPVPHSRVATIDQDVLADLLHCGKQLGFRTSIKVKASTRKSGDGPQNFSVHFLTGAKDWLRHHGMAGKNSFAKRVPKAVFCASEHQVAQFLGAYFACDGSVSQPKGTRATNTMPTVVQYSSNKPLLEDCQHLYLRLGIQTSLCTRNGRYNGEPIVTYALRICDVRKFAATIPVLGGGLKVDRLKRIREHFQINEFDTPFLVDHILELGTTKATCRCLTVDVDSTFTANDIVVHNSEFVSRMLPAWILGRNPDAKVLACTNTADNAGKMNDAVQRIIDSPAYHSVFPGTTLFAKNVRTEGGGSWKRNSDIFEIVGRRGQYFGAGTGTAISGNDATHAILDDLYRSDQHASSIAHRKSIESWYTADFLQRRNDERVPVLITTTRRGEADLIGHLERVAREHPDNLKPLVVRFPALAEDDRPTWDPRNPGDALWPDKFSRRYMEERRRSIPTIQWAAMFQQRPTADTGVIFRLDKFRDFKVVIEDFEEEITERNPQTLRPEVRKVARRREVAVLLDVSPDGEVVERRYPESVLRFFAVADTASTPDGGDYSVVGTFALTPAQDLLIWSVQRERLAVPVLYGWLCKARDLDKRVMFLAVEDKDSGRGLIQQSLASGRPFRALSPEGMSKEVRAAQHAGVLLEAGKLFVRAEAPWRGAVIDEMLAFPRGANDDVCFVAGTMIETASGPVPIELVNADDMVWTRDGLRRVEWAGATGISDTIEVDLGWTKLCGTPGHPVWTGERRFARLDSIAYADTIMAWQKNLSASRLSGTASPSIGGRTPGRNATASTSRRIRLTAVRSTSTARYGRQPTDRSHAVVTSTTSTVTQATMNFQTSPASLHRSTENCILKATIGGLLPSLRTSRAFDQRQPAGTDLLRGEPGTLRTQKQHGSEGRPRPTSASGAASCTRPDSTAGENSAPTPAALRPGETQGLTTDRASASTAASHSSSTGMPRLVSARVIASRRTGRRPVYNLKVAGSPEYFANGVLVHNCDVCAYAARLVATDSMLRSGQTTGELWLSPSPGELLGTLPDGTPRFIEVAGHRVAVDDQDW